MFDDNDRRELRDMFREFGQEFGAVLMNAMDEKIRASEARMMAAMDEKISAAVTASEGRMMAAMDEKIRSSEGRMLAAMDEKNADLRSQIMTYLESKIEPQIRLLAEGHENLMRTLAPRERVDRLEGDVVILKQAVHTLREDVDQLRQAE